MNINVPPQARDHFWEEPPADSMEFWSFRFPPPCKVGDPLIFRFDGEPVAKAVVCKIEPPGQSKCDGTGRFERGWKVFWTQESFHRVIDSNLLSMARETVERGNKQRINGASSHGSDSNKATNSTAS